MSKQGCDAEKMAYYTEDDLFRFGVRVAKQRHEHGWKQREVSRRTGIHPTRLSRIERGAVWPGIGELVALERVFGLGLDELVFGPKAIPVPGSEEERLIRAILETAPTDDRDALLRYLRATLTGYRIARRAPHETPPTSSAATLEPRAADLVAETGGRR